MHILANFKFYKYIFVYTNMSNVNLLSRILEVCTYCDGQKTGPCLQQKMDLQILYYSDHLETSYV